VELQQQLEMIESAGLSLVAVGMGTPARTRDFARSLGLTFPFLADPRRQAYEAYRLTKMNWRNEMRLSFLARSIKSGATYGARPTAEQDTLQLGGTFIVNTDGTFLYAHRSEATADYPSPTQLLSIVS
jgi:hypothetical protein